LTLRLGETGNLTVPLSYDIASNNAMFNREMVLEGFGIGAAPAALVQSELLSGKLVPLFEDFEVVDGEIEIRLAYNSRALLPAKARVFIENAGTFFVEEMAVRRPARGEFEA
jgi:DNA-binding transcriptional LysR family regulator